MLLGGIVLRTIGILTSWTVPNYGAFMQAYALQRIVANLFPEDKVLQIGHLNKVHYNTYYSIVDTNYRLWPINPHFYKNTLYRIKNLSKIKHLKVFLSYFNMIPNTGNINGTNLKRKYFDIIILGSDIIWDYTQSSFGQDQFLFGNDFCAGKIISYAPSFGTVKPCNEPPSYVVKGLNGLAAISVRDENSAKLVEQYTGKEALVVLDPTLLMDADDENFVRPDIKDYIIVYGSSFSPELIRGAREYADKHHLKLVCLDSLDDTFDWCDLNISQENLSPFAWCGYFKYAEAVFTCTYHGLMFGLIFKKRIIFHPTPFILDKASSLIDYLGLREVLIEKKTFEDKADWSWDYADIYRRLLPMREKSLAYLKESLKENG